jgi:phosphate-selective porin OprO/OprP
LATDEACSDSLPAPIIATIVGLLLAFCLPAVFVAAQTRLPPIETDDIQAILERQQREIDSLRRLLQEQKALAIEAGNIGSGDTPAPLESIGSLAGRETSDLAPIYHRIEALEKAHQTPKEGQSDWVDLSGEKWAVKLGGHMQLDSINWTAADDPPIPADNYVEFRRLRLLADGVGYGVFDFRLQIDIEPEAEDTVTTPVTVIKDAYLTMHEIPFFHRWRIGNFFVPYSLEQVTNDTNNIFLERSIPTQGIFAADREVGTAVYGVSDDQNMTWTCGWFIDSFSEALKERIDDNQGQRISGRLTWLPYYDEPSKGRYLIHTGVGVLYTDDQDGLARFRARPQIHEGPFLIDTGQFPASTYTSGNLELAVVWGPFSVQSEMFLCNVNRRGVDRADLWGGYLYFSYFLTGENRIYERYGQHGAQFARNVPFTNFFWVPGCIGSGAWELKARTSYLDLSEVDHGRYNDLTIGLNWYWTDRIRIMFDWIQPFTSEETVYGETHSSIVAMRFDYNF